MTLQMALETLTETGIRIELENGNLRYHSPKPLDYELISLIRTHKAGLVRLLGVKEAPPNETFTDVVSAFRDWWWNEFDSRADDAEFDAGSDEAASELFPIFRNLVWPDFEVIPKCRKLVLNRICERYYPRHLKSGHHKKHVA